MPVRLPITLTFLLLTSVALARGSYQTSADFISEVFNADPPKASLLWITKSLRPSIRDILGHDLGRLRQRYWQSGNRSAWVLEEIGKEHPITVGLVVADKRLERIKVLTYRESRGAEVRHPFFTDQFKGAILNGERRLDRSIDGISGATLSVRALTKLARLALYLSQQIPSQ
ncbi:MAG: FMN-binding protein [Thiohalomonadales bacterium]